MSQTKNIIIVGASWAGLSAAHYFLKHILPRLNTAGSTAYYVYLIDRSSKFYWRLGAPRAMVSPNITPSLNQRIFEPIAEGFKQYDQSTFTFLLGTATAMDPTERKLVIKMEDGEQLDLPYHALIIATGSRTLTPVTSLHGSHTITEAALKQMHENIANNPKTIIIGGGGPVAVETGGELGEFLNGAASFFASRPKYPKAKVTIITSFDKLLPILRPALAKQAEVLLNRVGVDVMYNKRITNTSTAPNGQTTVTLKNGETMTCDLYIPAVGATPCSEYVPEYLKNEKGYVKTNQGTLRVDAAGPRVYCIGDVGDCTNSVLQIYDAIPVLMTNVKKDLLEAAASGDGKKVDANLKPDRIFKKPTKETQIVPVGTSRGVGAFNGYKVPGMMVSMVKGKEYWVNEAKLVVNGDKFVKESL